MTPRVSVVVPTRNRLASLMHTLASVDAQSFRDFELLVVDDASTDGTADWLRGRASVRVFTTPEPAGAAAARNLGIEHARGELVAFLDDDDVWEPNYLAAQVAHLDANPAATLSYADHHEVDPGGRRSRPDTRSLVPDASPLVRLLAESFIHTPSVVVCRRDAFDRFGRFDDALTIVHDLEWYLRVLAGGGDLSHLARSLVERSVPGGLVTAHRRWFHEEREVIERALGGSADARMVRAYRSLFFARVALPKGDLAFGLARLADALRTSPGWAVHVAAVRVLRRLRTDRLGQEARSPALEPAP